jgi:hypothetical protein
MTVCNQLELRITEAQPLRLRAVNFINLRGNEGDLQRSGTRAGAADYEILFWYVEYYLTKAVESPRRIEVKNSISGISTVLFQIKIL